MLLLQSFWQPLIDSNKGWVKFKGITNKMPAGESAQKPRENKTQFSAVTFS